MIPYKRYPAFDKARPFFASVWLNTESRRISVPLRKIHRVTLKMLVVAAGDSQGLGPKQAMMHEQQVRLPLRRSADTPSYRRLPQRPPCPRSHRYWLPEARLGLHRFRKTHPDRGSGGSVYRTPRDPGPLITSAGDRGINMTPSGEQAGSIAYSELPLPILRKPVRYHRNFPMKRLS